MCNMKFDNRQQLVNHMNKVNIFMLFWIKNKKYLYYFKIIEKK